MPSAENRALRRWDVTLQAGGEARITETLTITGQAAPEWREHYQAAIRLANEPVEIARLKDKLGTVTSRQ